MPEIVRVVVVLGGVALWSCTSGNNPSLTATVTFKDGSHFSGTVIRREPNSITLVDSTHETRTFLYSEVLDIKYATPGGGQTGAPVGANSGNGMHGTEPAQAVSADSATVSAAVFPAGTEFPVVSEGFLDSCCVPVGAFSVGTLDADVKADGKVVLPRGASLTIMLLDKDTVDGRISMKFELGAASFGGHQYMMSSAKGSLEPGAVDILTGPKQGTPEAKSKGPNIHIDDHGLMMFKAATPTSLRLSQ